ncbi:MAG: hypothetical protein H6Q68_2285 [Firmicutes bacterium]|nr:hypothetical protein [Bacillota bacterium]
MEMNDRLEHIFNFIKIKDRGISTGLFYRVWKT